MKLEFAQEMRYDGTDEEGVHVHFNCPVCKNVYAGTDMYCDLYTHIEKIGDTFTCECAAEFKLISGDCWDGEYDRVL